MSVVIKQSLQATVHLYIGIAIGFVTAIVVFPRVFTPEEVGLLNILMQISLLITQFGIVGLPGVITYYFASFRDDKFHHGFPMIVAIGTAVGCVLSVLFIYVFKSWIISKYPNPLFIYHYNQLVLLTVASIVFVNLDSYYKSFYNVVLSTFLKETFQRVLMLVAVVFFMVGIIGFDVYVVAYSAAVAIPSVWLFAAIVRDGHFSLKTDWKFVTPQIRTGMMTVAAFNVLASLTTYVNVGIDRIMISSLGGLEAGGIYSTTILFGTLVSLPSRTIRKITSVMFAENWKSNDVKAINDVYKKSCLTLFIIGLLLFLCIWGNIDNILTFLPPEYAAGKWAIFWGCVTNLIEMLSGAAVSLIGTSKHYKAGAYQAIILVVVIVGANILFIPMFGLTGAAFATALSFFIYNAMRFFYIYYRWKFQPLGIETLYVLLLSIASFFGVWLIPQFTHFIVDSAIRSVLFLLSFGGVVYFLKLSPDVNRAADMVLKKIPVIKKVVD